MFETKESRASRGKKTAFEYKGKPVDSNKLARLAKGLVSKFPGRSNDKAAVRPKIAPRIFIMWNMPYGALRYSQRSPIDHVSPIAIGFTPAGKSDIFLYQFSLSAYKTARHWRKGLHDWTLGLLDLNKYMENLSVSAAGAPGSPGASPDAEQHHVPASQWLVDGVTPSIVFN
ncbi:uncharacterized protein Z519_01306 [Cladophialophora bantiana CBS 173.52]|uniref:Uncharacterized protein n=1 Tax=Cladophialophora bantiana (strain ATCC 10958 / CBS 173.52 / CDC B-1940 / NIH 8579) TaxID=1442370 RepID=A0A0D2GH89_CLAB1|nr:uncharacterized protein Z519_01306 [Cladophialophora bantiana CBS 173.52]KIW97722.1 hypothetical protein Z519_01306 [Cladophialophora bantiana CBS 173.52]